MLGEVRSATVVCKEKTEFAILTRKDFKDLLENVEINKIQNDLHFFMQNLFQNFEKEYVISICYKFEKVKYNLGNCIFEEGDAVNNYLYLIKKGEIEVIFNNLFFLDDLKC